MKVLINTNERKALFVSPSSKWLLEQSFVWGTQYFFKMEDVETGFSLQFSVDLGKTLEDRDFEIISLKIYELLMDEDVISETDIRIAIEDAFEDEEDTLEDEDENII